MAFYARTFPYTRKAADTNDNQEGLCPSSGEGAIYASMPGHPTAASRQRVKRPARTLMERESLEWQNNN